jgi:phosphate:Na+ symporter
MMILKLLGGLGVFLFGMRTMSTGLQKVAGSRLRELLALCTRNRFTGIVSGFLMTCSVQSSSATTVMIVSFADAGLLTLTQAIGPVMGANIGTTVTGWLVSILGFEVNITAFALPIIGIGFPLTMMRNTRAKNWGETAIGFGLLFMGLAFLKDAVPAIDSSSASGLEFLQQWAGPEVELIQGMPDNVIRDCASDKHSILMATMPACCSCCSSSRVFRLVGSSMA